VQHEAGPQHAAAAEAEHQREQPDDPLRVRLVGEHRAEVREVGLRLTARMKKAPTSAIWCCPPAAFLRSDGSGAEAFATTAFGMHSCDIQEAAGRSWHA